MAVLVSDKIAVDMSKGLDMGQWQGTSGNNTTTTIYGTDGYHEGVYGGSFTLDGMGNLVSGTVTSYTAWRGGPAHYQVTGISMSANTLFAYNSAGEFVERDQFFFRGDDNISGSTAGDKLYGWAGTDRLRGNGGSDILVGAEGNDYLRGNFGNDTLQGGSGQDSYWFDSGLNGATNVDTILGFSHTDDSIHLDNAIFKKLVGVGVLSSNEFRANTSGKAMDGNDHIIYETDTGKLFYDADGTGHIAKVQFALLGNGDSHPALGASDFFVF